MLGAIRGIALSGLDAARTRLSVSAHNVSNMNTEGFKAGISQDVEQPGGRGVRPEVSTRQRPGPTITGDDGRRHTLSNTDVADEAGQMILARNAYRANLQALKVADRMEEEAIHWVG